MNNFTMPPGQGQDAQFALAFLRMHTMKTRIAIIHLVVALIAWAAPVLPAAPASLLNFKPVNGSSSAAGYVLALSGNHAYTIAGTNLQVVDVSNPTNQVIVGSVSLPPRFWRFGMAVAGHHAYVGYKNGHLVPPPHGGFDVFDVSDSARPVRVGGYHPHHRIDTLAIAGQYAYVGFFEAVDRQGVRVLDVSNPTNPIPVGISTNCGVPIGMAVLSHRLYVANERGLSVIDVTDPLNPSLLGRHQTIERANDVVVVGHHAYVAQGWDAWSADSGLEVIDVSNPAQPQRVGLYRTTVAAARIMLHGDRAYVICDIDPLWWLTRIQWGQALQVFDVSDPASPLRVDNGNLSVPDSMRDVAVVNGHLFLQDRLYRIDEVPAVEPSLSMKRNNPPSVPELWVQSPGFDDFTLMTATSVTNWLPYATVFSRRENFWLPQDATGPRNENAIFYRIAGEVRSPAAMSLQWLAAGITNYQFRFQRSWFRSPKLLSGLVTVENRGIMRVNDVRADGVAIDNPDPEQFKSVEGFFWLLHSSQRTNDLTMIAWDAERHFPSWIYIDPSVQANDDGVTYRITDLLPIE